MDSGVALSLSSAGDSDDDDLQQATMLSIELAIMQTGASSSPAPFAPTDAGREAPINHRLTHASAAAPAAPTINIATEWLDEYNSVCPKDVDYATQCPKGHVLVPFADGGSSAPARLMCRICHGFTECEHALHWLVCSVTGCCGGYAVCDTCESALQQAPATVAVGGDFSMLVTRTAAAFYPRSIQLF